MPVETALIASEIEDADRATIRIMDRCGGAGQKMIRAEEVLVTMDNDRSADRKRRADRVGPAAGFGPLGAGRKRHLLGPCQKLRIAAAVQDITGIVGKHDHVLGINDLFEQDVHCRLGVEQQLAAFFHLVGEQAAFERAEFAVLVVVQPIA